MNDLILTMTARPKTTPTTPTNRNELLAATLNSQSIIGAAVWWSVPNDVTFSQQTMLSHAAGSGLGDEIPPGILPKPITPGKAFIRTAHAFENPRTLVRRVSGTPLNDLTIQITEEIPTDDELEYRADTIIRLNSQTHQPEVLANRTAATAAKIDALFDEYLRHYRSSDVRTMLIRTMKHAHALMLRDSGGIYFVAKTRMPIISTVTRFLKKINQGIEIFTLGIADSSEYRATTGKIAVEEISAEISAFSEDTAALIRPTARTTNVRLAELKRLAEKAEIYDIFLASKKDKIRQAIEHARLVLTQKLQEVE